jgi:hypothetical protein
VSKLLTNENPLIILPYLAKEIGLYEAIILQQIHYWILQERQFKDKRFWYYSSIRNWQIQFPFLSKRTLQRAFKKLKDQGLIITGRYNKMKADKTLWYSIDYEKLETIINKINIDSANLTPCIMPKWNHLDSANLGKAIPETKETTTDINKLNKNKFKGKFNAGNNHKYRQPKESKYNYQ